ncbi:S8 family serine peptidase [Haloplanus halophilus]|uniref:S8 family serine peptidase n=1 Tax=Haloplanus halophilus TaxID=2949993 RepID=UPI00203E891F|nr:S8 family serine peptidase [Haloplanus sp. GDY1]
MFDAPRARVALLTLVVVLAAVQPVPAGATDTPPATAATDGGGEVGTTIGSAVQRHPSGAGATADALRSVRADAVHARGLTGSGVDVGVIGRGFDASNGVIAPHVVERRRIGGPAGATAHDTAVAEVVSETAPSANLYLVGVGRTPTPAEYARAVEWLTDRGVDVVVDSGSYFPSVAGDGSRITAAAERATDEGVVFVTSAGNYANRHWAGEGAVDGWVTFAEDDAANHLADGDPIRGRVVARLRWQSSADYDLYLYRNLPNAPDRVVAKSAADESGPGLTVEGVDVAVPRGRYYLAVYADDVADDSPLRPARIQVFAARHELEHATAHGSMVAPATGDRVVAVGAAADGELAGYSSRSANGTVDLVAPGDARTRAASDLVGTSAAAPYVAGTAALMESAGRDPSPERVETILERTADGEGDSLDALAAVEAASDDATGGTAAGDPATDDRSVDAGVTDGRTADDRSTRDRSADGNATRSGGRDDGSRPVGADGDGRSRDGVSDRNGEDDRDRTERRDDGQADDPRRAGGSGEAGDSERDDRSARRDRA